MDDTMRTVQVLAQLDLLDTRFSIDDCGTGYSSLSYFRADRSRLLICSNGFANRHKHIKAAV